VAGVDELSLPEHELTRSTRSNPVSQKDERGPVRRGLLDPSDRRAADA
jgi:hypothetical protein